MPGAGFSSAPDALLVTNLLDQHENSAVYPCYEREDLLLRYLEWTLGKWKAGKAAHAFSRMKTPELVVCNYTSFLLGWQSLDFEVLGFPMDAQDTRVKVMLDVCDTSVPPPGGALHWYHLEMENAKGRKFQTLPIWDEDGSRAKTVKVPVWKEDGSFAEFEIEDTRVPYWHYPVDDDTSPLLLDVSGWEHHGRLLSGKYDFGGGHLNYTGYNHCHNGYAAPAGGLFAGRFRRDSDGSGH